MAISLHTLAPNRGSRPKKTRLGRGYASGRGTTAGRGTKGQRARTGGRKRLKLKGLKQMLLAFPKTRGFVSTFPMVYAVPLKRVMEKFQADERVDLDSLKAKNLLPKRAVFAKIIGGGEADKRLVIKDIRVTTSVKAALEKAGARFETTSTKTKK